YQADKTSAIDAAALGSHPVDSFNYTISDGLGGSTTQSASFSIDRPAVSHDDAVSTFENASVTRATMATGVLGNDVDPDTNDNTGTAVASVEGSSGNLGVLIALASGAHLTLNGNGTYTYDPNHVFDALAAGQSATDTFHYTLSSGSAATVTVTINGVDS